MRDEPLLWDEHGRPLSREGEMVAPAAFNVAQVYQLPGKLFPYRWDEAMRDAPQAALAMRRDAFYRSLIQERIAPTVNTEWQVEVDDPDNPVHQTIADTLQRAWRAVPDKVHLISWLLSASIWYGRAAVQGVWGKTPNGIWTWVEHEPVNGDSIQFQWDGTPVILVSKFTADKYRVLDPDAVIGMTDRGGFGLRLYKPEYRTRFIILKHSREASDYFEGEMAGGVHGVGVRSWVYWNDYFRRNALYAMIDWLANVGMADILVFNYPANNIEARQRAEENARKLHNRVAILCGRNPNETYPPVEQISLSAEGINALKDWISTYADRHIRELIVGQTMSSGADREDGLGGTGRAEFAKDTKYQLVKTDTLRLAEALTKDWLIPARNFNFPGSQVPVRMKPLWDDPKQKERAENVQKAISWGVPVEVDEVRTVLGLRKPRPGYPTIGGNSPGASPVPQTLRLAEKALDQGATEPAEVLWLYERLQPGSYHKTAKGWTAKNPAGELRWFAEESQAKAWAQGGASSTATSSSEEKPQQEQAGSFSQDYVEKVKQQRATAAKLHQRLQEERKPFWDVIAQSQVAPSVALEAAAYSLVSGVAPRAIWQSIEKPGEEITPIGDGHDVRAEEGKRVILLDAKTRLQKKGVVITDRTERISKILETLQALEQGKDVFSGYLHSGPNGLTLVTGYPEKTEATYTDIKTDVSEWLDALRGRLSQQPPDYDTPLPALRLESGLRVGASGLEGWGKDGVQLARERLRQALEAVLEDEDLSRRYREFLKEQGYKRLSDRVAREVAAMGPERFAEAIKRYLKDSPELARRLMEMVPELRKAAFEVASEKEIADAVVKKGADKIVEAAPELQDAALKVTPATKMARAAAEKDALTTAVAGLAGLNLAPEKIAEFLTAQGQKVTVEQIRQILGQAK